MLLTVQPVKSPLALYNEPLPEIFSSSEGFSIYAWNQIFGRDKWKYVE